jgi:F-type H+-transporting ATPase subunit b
MVLLEAASGSILHLDSALLIELGIQWFNTIVLTLILAKVLYKPVKKFMDSRSERIARQIGEAKDAEQVAQALKTEYESKLRDIETERAEILDTTRKKALEKSGEILNEAKTDAGRIRDRAAHDISMEQDKIRDSMKKEIVNISTLLAGRFVTASLDKKTRDRLIQETLRELEDVQWLG